MAKTRLLRGEWFLVSLILLAALLLRFYFLVKVQQPPLFGDAKNYDAMVRRLLTTGVYSYWGGGPDAYVTPGYPLFLAMIYKLFWAGAGSPLMKVRGIQALLSVGTILLSYLIVRRLHGVTAAMLTALVSAFYVSMVWSPAAVLTETLFVFLFMLYVYLFLLGMQKESVGWTFLSGGVFALSVLVRPASAPLLILPLFYHFFIQRRRNILWLLTATALGFVLVMIPWWIRNLESLGHLVLLATQSGNPLLAGTDPYFREGDALFKNLQGVDQSALAWKRIREGFTQETWLFIKWFTVGKWWYMFRSPWYDIPHAGFLDSLIPMHLPIVVIGWLSIVLAWVWRELRLFAFILIGMTGIQLMFLPLTRYAFPMMPFLIMGGAIVLARLLTRQEGNV
jgi:4-amino-4-deoxy-L-arabinose transferase-like glycosyltransferase